MRKRSAGAVLVLAALVLVVSVLPAAMAADGDLDTTFGTYGKVTTDIGLGNDGAYSIAIQSDGKIVAAGYSNNGSNNDFALARYNANGSLDTSFGSGGKVTTPIGSAAQAWSVAIQSDGKIVAAGNNYTNTNDPDFALARYNTNGTLDTSFGSGGKLTTPIGSDGARARSVAIQSDGKIVAAGSSADDSTWHLDAFALARYNSNGTLDTSFDADGKVTTPGDFTAAAQSVAIQSDGKIVAAGSSWNGYNTSFALARYNTDGTLDTSFDTDGKLTTPIGSEEDLLYSIAIQSDGKIVAAGSSWSGSNRDFALVRYNTDGTLDTSFDTDGKLTTPIGPNDRANAYSVAIQSDGKIVAAGWFQNYYSTEFALARYNTDGSLDTSFGSGGKLTTPISSAAQIWSVAIQSDGKIVAAGSSWNGYFEDFALVRYGGPYGGPPPTSLSIKAKSKVPKGTKVSITGALSSVDASCTSAQQVTLKKGSATVGTAITANTPPLGAYKFTLKIKKKTTVQVIYAGTAACGSSASPKKTIKVS